MPRPGAACGDMVSSASCGLLSYRFLSQGVIGYGLPRPGTIPGVVCQHVKMGASGIRVGDLSGFVSS